MASTPGIVQTLVEALLPDLAARLDDLAAQLDEAIPAPPMLEAIAVQLIGLLLARGTVTLTTSGQITLAGHKGAHPSDA